MNKGRTSHERRRHRRFLTRNTEYHLKDEQCVGVRCRESGEWFIDHVALGKALAGGMSRTAYGYEPAPPAPGASLWFDAGNSNVITSTVEAQDRPEKASLQAYLQRAA